MNEPLNLPSQNSPADAPTADERAISRAVLSLRVFLAANFVCQAALAGVFWWMRDGVSANQLWQGRLLGIGGMLIGSGLAISIVFQMAMRWVLGTARSLRSAIGRYAVLGIVSMMLCDLGGTAFLAAMLLGGRAPMLLPLAAFAAVWPILRWWPWPHRLAAAYERMREE